MSIKNSQRCAWHPKRPAHACLDCYLNNVGLEPMKIEWFVSPAKPSMYVRYYFDKDGILKQEINPIIENVSNE
jgi:hypothetical protein